MTDRLSDIDKESMRLEAERFSIIEKAMRSGTPADMLRAADELSKIDAAINGDRKSYVLDPFVSNRFDGYLTTPSGISMGFLKKMGRTPLVRSIISTRQNQIIKHANPTVDMSTVGWTIRKKRSLFDDGKNKDLSKDDQKAIESHIRFIQDCGDSDGDDKFASFERPSFSSFLSETLFDSLSMDNMAFECVDNRRGNLSSFVSVDGETVRYADRSVYYNESGDPLKDALKFGHVPKYVQIYNNRPVAIFYPWQMCLGIRNRVTDIKQSGYGISELEDLIKIVTWQLFGDQYNGNFFSNGAAPKGILKVQGNVNQTKLNEFRMYWQQLVTGVGNAWRTPVLESDKVEWIDLQKSNQDMQFSNWAEYLIRIICSVYKIDSTEIGFVFKSGGAQADNNMSHKQRTDYSKDKGLLPLFASYEGWMNQYVQGRRSKDYEFAWTGLSSEDESELLANEIKEVSNRITINELRARKKEPPIRGGDIILNPTFIQGLQMSMMGNQESDQYVDDNEEDDSGDDSEDGLGLDKGAVDELNRWIKAGMPNTLQKINS